MSTKINRRFHNDIVQKRNWGIDLFSIRLLTQQRTQVWIQKMTYHENE